MIFSCKERTDGVLVREYPLSIPFFAIIAGVIFSRFLEDWAGYGAVVSLVLVLVSYALLKRVFFWGAVALFWCWWGASALHTTMHLRAVYPFLTAVDGKQVVIEGVVSGRSQVSALGTRLRLEVEQIIDREQRFVPKHLIVLVQAEGTGSWLSGDRIRFRGQLRLPRLLGLPGEFDYPGYLEMQGIHAVARVSHVDDILLMRAEARSSFLRPIERVAQTVSQAIISAVPKPERHGVLLALVTGEQRSLPVELNNAYARSGVNHILSVSGFHVGVLTAVWVLALRWILIRWEWLALRCDIRRFSLLTALPLMVVYLVFTGSASATVRAVVMLAVGVLALWNEREVKPQNALLTAAFVLCLYDPRVVFDISFQLSFLAFWGLIVITPLLLTPFRKYSDNRIIYGGLTLIASSVAAILATLVPVLACFHQASVIGIIANLVIVPLLGYIVTVWAMVAVPLVFIFPAGADIMYKWVGVLVDIANSFVVQVARIPVMASYAVGNADVVVLVMVLAVLGFVSSTRIRICLISTIILLSLVLHIPWHQDPPGQCMVTFLSVGQGDASLIQFPDGKTMLIDGGGYLFDRKVDFGTRYLVPALHALNVRRIDIMVMSHPHPDHIGGLPAVAEQFDVHELWQPKGAWELAEYQRLVRAVRMRGGVIRQLVSGDQPLSTASTTVKVLAPTSDSGSTAGGNDGSLVLRVQHAGASLLFMGDAGVAVEEQLIGMGLEPVTILKVGHHGSKTASSEQFLHNIHPKIAVISVGYLNRFGLPNQQVLDRFRAVGTSIYRTDQQGTIRITSDSFGCIPEIHLEQRYTSWQRDVLF